MHKCIVMQFRTVMRQKKIPSEHRQQIVKQDSGQPFSSNTPWTPSERILNALALQGSPPASCWEIPTPSSKDRSFAGMFGNLCHKISLQNLAKKRRFRHQKPISWPIGSTSLRLTSGQLDIFTPSINRNSLANKHALCSGLTCLGHAWHVKNVGIWRLWCQVPIVPHRFIEQIWRDLRGIKMPSFPCLHWFIAQQKIEYAGDGSSICREEPRTQSHKKTIKQWSGMCSKDKPFDLMSSYVYIYMHIYLSIYLSISLSLSIYLSI